MAVAWWVDVSTVEEAGLVRRRRRGPGVVLLLRRGGGGGSMVGGGRCRRGGRSVGTDGGGGAELLEERAARGRVLTGVNSVTRVFETDRVGALLRLGRLERARAVLAWVMCLFTFGAFGVAVWTCVVVVVFA